MSRPQGFSESKVPSYEFRMLLQAKRMQLLNPKDGLPLASESPRFEAIESALARIKEGNYGVCAQCRKTIERERLKNDPTAQRCCVHAEG